MLKRIVLGVLFMTCILGLNAQDVESKVDKKYKYQFGLNITDAISNLINVTDNATAIDPYTFDFRKIGEKRLYRLGFKIKFKKNDANLFPGDVERTVSFLDLQTRIGIQKATEIFNRLDLFWGFDLLGGFERDISESFTAFESLRNTENLYSIGLGPIVGFEYHLNKRFSISTYSSLYYTFSYENKELREIDSDNLLEASNAYIHEIAHILPNSIFFHFSF